MIEFRVNGIPKGQPRPKAFARKFGSKWSARVYDPGTAEAFKNDIAIAAKPHIPATPILGPVYLRVTFYFPRLKAHYKSNGEVKDNAPNWHLSKPDTDNCMKAVKDCLTILGFWRDDSQVCFETAQKIYGNPGAYIAIEEMGKEFKVA